MNRLLLLLLAIVVDEIEIFVGEENGLVMTQSYTREFQCVYELTMYPFDTQACTISKDRRVIKPVSGMYD